MSDWKIRVELDTEINECQCCGKKNLKRTIKISGEDIGEIYLGVICASEWFLLNLTGNPYYAASKLDKHINLKMTEDELEQIIEEIKEAAENW